MMKPQSGHPPLDSPLVVEVLVEPSARRNRPDHPPVATSWWKVTLEVSSCWRRGPRERGEQREVSPPGGEVSPVSPWHPQVPLGGNMTQRRDVPPGWEVAMWGEVPVGWRWGWRRDGGRAAGVVQPRRRQAGWGRGEVWGGDGEVFIHGGGRWSQQPAARRPLQASLVLCLTALPPGRVAGRSLRCDLDTRHGGEVAKQWRLVGVAQEVRRWMMRKVRSRVGGGHSCDWHGGQAVRLRAGGARTSLRGGVAIIIILFIVFIINLIAVFLSTLWVISVWELVLCHGTSGNLFRSLAFLSDIYKRKKERKKRIGRRKRRRGKGKVE